jgi:hypothetical protein
LLSHTEGGGTTQETSIIKTTDLGQASGPLESCPLVSPAGTPGQVLEIKQHIILAFHNGIYTGTVMFFKKISQILSLNLKPN